MYFYTLVHVRLYRKTSYDKSANATNTAFKQNQQDIIQYKLKHTHWITGGNSNRWM